MINTHPSIALIADVHGNLPGLNAVLQDLKTFNPAVIAVAGDLTGGPFSNEVIKVLAERKSATILGNSDISLLKLIRQECPKEWQTNKQFGLLRWNARNLSHESTQYLFSLPEQTVINFPNAESIRLVHGSPRDPFESIYPNKAPYILDECWKIINENVMVCGHTHEPWVVKKNGKLAINPGAVAGPLNGEVGAQYATMIWKEGGWNVELRKVSYDFDKLKKAFIESGLLEEGGSISRSWLASMQTGRDVSLDFLRYAFKLSEQRGSTNKKFLNDEIWALAGETFPWRDYELKK